MACDINDLCQGEELWKHFLTRMFDARVSQLKSELFRAERVAKNAETKSRLKYGISPTDRIRIELNAITTMAERYQNELI